MSRIAYDRRAMTIDGHRRLILSGAMHYPRSTPAMWRELMRRSRELGLTTVETYVFWGLHERRRGVLDFSDRLDLPLFCRTAQEHGLNVILRAGPYICAETNYGGLPPWLRDVPGMRIRTQNEPFLAESRRWLRLLREVLDGQFAPQGGPIVLVQIENEYNNVARNYGDDGKRYIAAMETLADELDFGVPLIMCEGAGKNAIETLNGFSVHGRLADHRARHPGMPALWTESYAAWYDIWGYPHHARKMEDMAFHAARFFAQGGAGVNYYMWHGGTNFDRDAMYLQTTSYDFDAPLDEFGLDTTKGRHLGRLHGILLQHEDLLLGTEPPAPQSAGPQQLIFDFRKGDQRLAFLCNDSRQTSATIRFEGRDYSLPPESVTLVNGQRMLMNTDVIETASRVTRRMSPRVRSLSPWLAWREPVPAKRPITPSDEAVTSAVPVEQLGITKDETDYCWYSTVLTVRRGETQGTLDLRAAADVVHVFVDGRYVASTPSPLQEDRGAVDGTGYLHSFPLNLKAGNHALEILCTAIGMSKGDWQLGHRNMVEEKKGIWAAVSWCGKDLQGAWRMRKGLLGERNGLFRGDLAPTRWSRVPASNHIGPLTWCRTTFRFPNIDAPLAIELTGLNKGMLWLNGRSCGRYWLAAAGEVKRDNPYLNEEGAGQPTQRHYHLPAEWMATENTIVIFEEVGGTLDSVRLCAWAEA